jgi:hypothetical protein
MKETLEEYAECQVECAMCFLFVCLYVFTMLGDNNSDSNSSSHRLSSRRWTWPSETMMMMYTAVLFVHIPGTYVSSAIDRRVA